MSQKHHSLCLGKGTLDCGMPLPCCLTHSPSAKPGQMVLRCVNTHTSVVVSPVDMMLGAYHRLLCMHCSLIQHLPDSLLLAIVSCSSPGLQASPQTGGIHELDHPGQLSLLSNLQGCCPPPCLQACSQQHHLEQAKKLCVIEDSA